MTITQNFLVLGFLGFIMLVNWVSAAALWMKVYYPTKVLAILTLLFFFYTQGGAEPHRLVFLVGLAFSVLGDFFLVFREKRWFMAGLGAFFITQLCYIAGFNQNPLTPTPLVAGVALAFAVALRYFSYIDKKVIEKPEFQKGRNLFNTYAVAVILMATSAVFCLFRPGWYGITRWMVALGGVLFLVSDTLIGLERLGNRIPAVRFWIIFTYHLAQFLIVMAVASN